MQDYSDIVSMNTDKSPLMTLNECLNITWAAGNFKRTNIWKMQLASRKLFTTEASQINFMLFYSSWRTVQGDSTMTIERQWVDWVQLKVTTNGKWRTSAGKGQDQATCRLSTTAFRPVLSLSCYLVRHFPVLHFCACICSRGPYCVGQQPKNSALQVGHALYRLPV